MSKKEIKAFRKQRESSDSENEDKKKQQKSNKRKRTDNDDDEAEKDLESSEETDKKEDKDKFKPSYFMYEYDMGDSWSHSIFVEAIVDKALGDKIASVLTGFGACPPEDSGGTSGYQGLLDLLNAKPGDPEYNLEEKKKYFTLDFRDY